MQRTRKHVVNEQQKKQSYHYKIEKKSEVEILFHRIDKKVIEEETEKLKAIL